MEFKKYGSIENSYREKMIHKIGLEFGNDEFFVQEKIHGANFSLWTDGKEVKCAKRSGFIDEGENFHNSDKIVEKYRENVLDLYNDFLCDTLVVFGEVYGGSYPHEGVEECNVSKVQRGVFYRPDVDFIAYDVAIDGEYISKGVFENFCKTNNIPHLKTLFKGSFSACLEYNNKYQTTIPKMLGLPEIEGNFCEGNVIRPTITRHFSNGSRVILKNKNDSFAEKEHKKDIKPQKEIPTHITEFRVIGQQYVNENRLRNVLSKVGEVNEKEFGKLMGMLSKDTLEDFVKDTPNFLELDKNEQRMVTKFINMQCANLIRPNFLNIVDGNY